MKMRRTVLLLICVIFALSCACAEGISGTRKLHGDGAHMLALDSMGRVWAWGSNHSGESAPEDEKTDILAPVHVFSGASQIAAGQNFSMALDDSGRLFMWGANKRGQIYGFTGDKTAECVSVMENVSMIDACDERALALTKADVIVWGAGEEEKRFEADAVKAALGVDFVLILTSGGEVYEYSLETGKGECLLSGAKDIDASGQSRYAVTTNGDVFSWGANGTEGRIGLPETYDWAETPVKMQITGVDFIRSGLTGGCAVKDTGEMFVWGSIYSYMTAFDENGEEAASLVEGEIVHYGNTPIALYEGVSDAAFADAAIAVLFENGDVFTWGSNDHGQIGNGTITETRLVHGEEEGEYDIEVASFFQQIFPARPITLE
ncbi:MAG: hypothetical protein IJC48_03625 [Clostridia bacterium]|nr:hypothetical protein [Clostridia bacterium]